MMELLVKHHRVLRKLAGTHDMIGLCGLPDSSGRQGPQKDGSWRHASAATVADLLAAGLICHGTSAGYVITTAGREALKQEGR